MPILDRLRGDLDRLADQSLPKSALGQAVTYARDQWKALCRYTEDGRLTIDNNVAERRNILIRGKRLPFAQPAPNRLTQALQDDG